MSELSKEVLDKARALWKQREPDELGTVVSFALHEHRHLWEHMTSAEYMVEVQKYEEALKPELEAGLLDYNPFDYTPEDLAKQEQEHKARRCSRRRYEIARDVLAGFAANSSMFGERLDVSNAVKWADALLAALEVSE